MNRFRTKKKAKEDASAGRPSHDGEQYSLPSFKGFRRGKKSSEEPKKEIDLTSALPSNDDFRTSLLMTNLSARFSMLREQDDPNTKIGKASDDSVLLPRRQSRLADFGFSGGLGGLADIAEVESIRAPPSFTRMNSFASDDADSTKGGSIMSRAKPTEGNNLFGGRQKIYKIPVSGSTAKNQGSGGMGGRALYEDDVASSAFQLWRQAERKRRSLDGDDQAAESQGLEYEEEPRRSESPGPLGYNRRRETSSTTSSASAVARNSTAATSITSQPPTLSMKDWQSTSTAPPSAASTPVLERNVTRTRRLYEQGLTQDLHDQQSSALSRMDTLGRQRNIGTRTPDLVYNSPSPTNFGFSDRFASERRPILAKASAPNLRSISPPTTGSSLGTTPGLAEARANFGGSPPLSPPISETGDNSLLPIQPNDRGKATALGVFHKPVQAYDESKYAQRQLQLRHGRETPTQQRVRTESNASFATGRSRSSSSVRGQPLDTRVDTPTKVEPARQEKPTTLTFLNDSDDSAPIVESRAGGAPQSLSRPSDKDHPAFRESALPTPLSANGKISEESSPISENLDSSVANSRQDSPADSPTLGPTAGLSGMVRQHLRSESNASSNYGAPPQIGEFDSSFLLDDGHDTRVMDALDANSNPWTSSGQDWRLSLSGLAAGHNQGEDKESRGEKESRYDLHTRDSSSNEMENETDEFASQLANARRRVRERLTSYVESDSSRGTSPHRQPETSSKVLANQVPQSGNPLGIGILKPKSSRGSLIDRSRTISSSQSKAMKMLGIAGSTMSTSPSPNKPTFDDKDTSLLATMEEEPPTKEGTRAMSEVAGEAEESAEAKSLREDESENTHPGLRAFRQARRELQRRKELETLAKHQAAQTSQPASERAEQASESQSNHTNEHGNWDHNPRRIAPRQRGPSEESRRGVGANSNPASRQASTERNRSSSETSGASSHGRPARLRNNSNAYDDQLRPNGGPRPPMRSPGLPGTDIRRSPIMPPQAYPGSNTASPMPSPSYFDRSNSPGNLTAQPSRGGYDSLSGYPSPSSPHDNSMGLPPSPFHKGSGSGAATPTNGAQSRRPSAPQSPAFSTTTSTLNESLKRVVKKDDISEPTFIMSTSRVPTVNLPYSASAIDSPSNSRSRSGSRSRSNSNTTGHNAPPLPPINPRRKWEGSRARGVFGPFMGRKEVDDSQATSSSPHLPLSGSSEYIGDADFADEGRSAFSVSDDEDGSKFGQRRKLRKATGDAQTQGMRSPGMRERATNPPMVAAGPPASRAVVTPGINAPSHAGGMF